MNYFPLNIFEKIIEFSIKNELIDNKNIKKIKNFFKKLQGLSIKNIQQLEKEDYIKGLFTKEEFLQLYCLYLNYNDKIIKDLFVEVNFTNVENLDKEEIITKIIDSNTKISKIVEKYSCFIFPQTNQEEVKKLIISIPLDRYIYNEITKLIGNYKLLVSYPFDVFKICNKIIEKIEQEKYESILSFVNKEKEAFPKIGEVTKDEIKEVKLNINLENLSLGNLQKQDHWESKKQKIDNLLKKKKFFIIGSPATNDKETIESFIEGGIQAIKLHLNLTHPVSKQKIGSFEEEKDKILDILIQYPNIIWGLVPGNLITNYQDFEEVEQTELESFFDFVDLFYHSYTPYYLNLNISKMVAIDKILEKEHLQSFIRYKFFGLELAIIDKQNYGLPLTLEDIINYENIAKKTDIPVFVATQKKLKPQDIISLYNVGVKGLVLGQVVTSFQIDKIKKTVYDFLDVASKL